MGYQLTQLDVCLPDYFSGYHDPVLQVPVFREITKAELTEAIVSEYNMVWDYLVEDWPDLKEATLREMCDAFILTEQPFLESTVPTRAEDQVHADDCVDSVFLFIICEEV